MNLSEKQARFLIAARSILTKVKMSEPDVNIYDREVSRVEIMCISRLTGAQAEEAARELDEGGLIHVRCMKVGLSAVRWRTWPFAFWISFWEIIG